MRRVLSLFAAALTLFVVVTGVITAGYRAEHVPVTPAAVVRVPDGAAERLAGAIRIPTISTEDPATFDPRPFRELHAYLEGAFPRVHAHLRRETVATHSLLYTWNGTDPSLKPILLIGHLDVVPVDPLNAREWQQDPFSGRIADGFIWGRGAIDNKSTVVGVLEAAELLLAAGFRPARTVYVAYGHDEEAGGTEGAARIAALLASRGVQLEMVLDEGGIIGDGVMPGLSAPVAFVGIAEKGFVTIELSTRTQGGHSSLPPRDSAVGILSAAVSRLEQSQMPARLEGPARETFNRVGPEYPFPRRAMFANLWLTEPFVTRTLEKTPATNAMVRTTTALTIFQAGTKDNVLPGYARATVNFRILPGDSIASVVAHVRHAINDDRVEVRTAGRFSSEPSSVSSAASGAFRTLERAIRSVSGDVVVAPYLVVVVTDARYYASLTANVFRFLPLRMTPRDLERMHGVDERIAVEHYESAIRTYRQIIIDAAGEK